MSGISGLYRTGISAFDQTISDSSYNLSKLKSQSTKTDKKLKELLSSLDDSSDYDGSKLSSKTKDFIRNYNKLISDGKNSDDSTVNSYMDQIKKKLLSKKDDLEAIGIRVGTTGKINISEDKFDSSISDGSLKKYIKNNSIKDSSVFKTLQKYIEKVTSYIEKK